MKTNVISILRDMLITFVVLSFVVIGLVWFVHTFNVFELPAFINAFFEDDSDDEELVSHLENNVLTAISSEAESEGKYSYVSFTEDEVKAYIASLDVTDEFYWQVETTVNYKEQIRTQNHSIYKKGEKVRIDTVEADADYMTLITEDGTVVVNNSTVEYLSFSGDTDFSYTSLINVAALDRYLETTNGKINAVSVADRVGEKYLYVEIVKDGVNVKDEFLVSLEHGIVMYGASFVDGVQYFTQTTLAFDDESLISDKAFELNNSREAELLTSQ